MGTDAWRKYICEFIGTFALVFFAAGAVMISSITDGELGSIGAGLISGLVITIVVYTFGHISGAHVNPALSLTAVLIGRLDRRLLPGYVVSQMLGSTLAAFTLLSTIGQFGMMGANMPNTELGVTPGVALVIEMFLSFLLMWVVCGSAFSSRAQVPLAGVAIGATVGIEVMLMGSFAGAAMNPARAFGPYLALGDFTHFWIYVVGPVAGMVAGGLTYKFTHAIEGATI